MEQIYSTKNMTDDELVDAVKELHEELREDPTPGMYTDYLELLQELTTRGIGFNTLADDQLTFWRITDPENVRMDVFGPGA